MAMAESTDKQVLIVTDLPSGHRQAAKASSGFDKVHSAGEADLHDQPGNKPGTPSLLLEIGR